MLQEERLRKNVWFIGVRTFERITEYSSFFCGFLEIEAPDGTQALIPKVGLQLTCQHGVKPIFKVLRQTGNWRLRCPSIPN